MVSAAGFNSPSFTYSSQGAGRASGNGSYPSNTNAFIRNAKSVAEDILGRNSSSSSASASTSQRPQKIGRVHIHHHYGYRPLFWDPWPSRTVYVVGDRGRRKDDNDRDFRILVGLIAGVVGSFAFYAVGANYNKYTEAEEELVDVRSFKQELYSFPNPTSREESNSLNSMKRISNLNERIFSRIKGDAAWNLATTVSVAAGCTIALVGALVASYTCMTAGAVIGFGTGAAMLVKWGMDSTDRKHRRDAEALLREINALPQDLRP